MYVSKNALNHFLVNSSAKDSLRRAKNVVFFLFCILVNRPMGGDIAPPPAPGYATGYVIADPAFHRAGPLALWRFSQHLSAKCR